MRPVPFLAIACAALVPTAAQAAEPLIIPARGEWTLVKAGERCSLVRDFGDEGDLRLRIDSFGTDTSLGFQLSGSLIPPSNDATTWITFALSTDTKQREREEVLTGKLGKAPFISFLGGFGPSTDDPASVAPGRTPAEAADGVSHIGIEFSSGRALRIETGSMTEPMARMRGCIDAMLTRWGLDPRTQRSLARRPERLPLTSAQLDQVLNVTRVAALTFVPVRVMVDAYGKATECVVQTANTGEAFDSRICTALSNGYVPALDANGQQVPSAYLLAISWIRR